MKDHSILVLPRQTDNHKKNFAEVCGEKEANSVCAEFLKASGARLVHHAGALTRADGSTREHVLAQLQRERGNAYVQRVVAAATGAPGRMVGWSQPEMVAEVARRKGAGSPLGQPARAALEGFFGADLGHVRVHTDSPAVHLSRELDARAFTVGRDIFFSPGAYRPASREGQGLLAHELTHVAQQTGLAAVQREEVTEEPPTTTSTVPNTDNEEEIATPPA